MFLSRQDKTVRFTDNLSNAFTVVRRCTADACRKQSVEAPYRAKAAGKGNLDDRVFTADKQGFGFFNANIVDKIRETNADHIRKGATQNVLVHAEMSGCLLKRQVFGEVRQNIFGNPLYRKVRFAHTSARCVLLQKCRGTGI